MPAIPELYLAGQGAGRAAVELLFGEANPCGKLAETFRCGCRTTSYLNFPGNGDMVEYREGVFGGLPVLRQKGGAGALCLWAWPLLHQLLPTAACGPTKPPCGTTTGYRAAGGDQHRRPGGREIVQLYVVDCTGAEVRPEKELKGLLSWNWSPVRQRPRNLCWTGAALPGTTRSGAAGPALRAGYGLLAGASSRDIRQRVEIELICTGPKSLCGGRQQPVRRPAGPACAARIYAAAAGKRNTRPRRRPKATLRVRPLPPEMSSEWTGRRRCGACAASRVTPRSSWTADRPAERHAALKKRERQKGPCLFKQAGPPGPFRLKTCRTPKDASGAGAQRSRFWRARAKRMAARPFKSPAG